MEAGKLWDNDKKEILRFRNKNDEVEIIQKPIFFCVEFDTNILMPM